MQNQEDQRSLKPTAGSLQRGARGGGNITTALNALPAIAYTSPQAAELAGCLRHYVNRC